MINITSDGIICPYSETLYSPEELLGMLLHRAKEFAQDSAGQPINEAVLTVPGFFNQAERRAVLKAAELGGLKVLQLMNDYTAGKFSIQVLELLYLNNLQSWSSESVPEIMLELQNKKSLKLWYVLCEERIY
jgi:hypothetical protein